MALSKLMKYCVFLSLARVVPHLANFTPIESVCLFSGSQQSKLRAILSMLIFITFSNIVVSFFDGISAFGYWSLFTYSAYILIVLLGKKLSQSYSFAKLAKFVLISSLIFWIWSNFGWWLTTSFYPKNSAGLFQCYVAALPYLRNSLLGNFCWSVIIFYVGARFNVQRKNHKTEAVLLNRSPQFNNQ